MDNCGSWGIKTPEGRLRPFFCGQRRCPREVCKKQFRWRRVRLIAALITEKKLDKFFTLTLDPDLIQPGENPWETIQHTWSKMRKRLRRIDAEMQYIAVLEKHKENDRPHIHGFTGSWFDQAVWADHWEACGGGRIVWIEQIKPEEKENVALYVGKYVGKENLCKIQVKDRGRTMWRSQLLKAEFELTKEEGYDIIKENVFTEEGELTWRGKQIERSIHGKKTK